MITVYFDMDDVITDFNKFYGGVDFDKTRFKNMVEQSIFTKLEEKPRSRELFEYVRDTLEETGHKFNIEFLSSLGAPNDWQVQSAGRRQKLQWLEEHGYGGYHANFVVHKGLKKRFATPHSILIDDTQQNIWDFNEHHGHGVLYREPFEDVIGDFTESLIQVVLSHKSNIISD